MKKIFFIIILFTSLIIGCQSAAQTAEASVNQPSTEWTNFKRDSESRIRNNEVHIADLKAEKDLLETEFEAHYQKDIDKVEQQNIAMKTQIAAYVEGKEDWKLFKQQFNAEMDALTKTLNALTVNNQK